MRSIIEHITANNNFAVSPINVLGNVGGSFKAFFPLTLCNLQQFVKAAVCIKPKMGSRRVKSFMETKRQVQWTGEKRAVVGRVPLGKITAKQKPGI
jgi:hypothetical protein